MAGMSVMPRKTEMTEMTENFLYVLGKKFFCFTAITVTKFISINQKVYIHPTIKYIIGGKMIVKMKNIGVREVRKIQTMYFKLKEGNAIIFKDNDNNFVIDTKSTNYPYLLKIDENFKTVTLCLSRDNSKYIILTLPLTINDFYMVDYIDYENFLYLVKLIKLSIEKIKQEFGIEKVVVVYEI